MVEGHFAGHRDRLLFRDYLIDHPEVAKEYADLKVRLASVSTQDRVAYTRGKTEFIVKVTEQVRLHFQRKQRLPLRLVGFLTRRLWTRLQPPSEDDVKRELEQLAQEVRLVGARGPATARK